MTLSWHKGNQIFFLQDRDNNLYVLREGAGGEVEQVEGFPPTNRPTGFALAENYDLIALPTSSSTAGTGPVTYLYVLRDQTSTKPELLATIKRLGGVAWHPSKHLLAGIYYPEGYQYGSNIVGVFDMEHYPSSVLTNTYELKYSAIREVFGWSDNSKVIAVSQYDENGAIPYYVYPASESVERSLFHTATQNCVIDARWAPRRQTIAFSGDNETLDGWDILLESVAPAESEGRSLVNLTNSPGEDEYNVSWSPDGREIVFVKGYEEAGGDLRQELFILDISDGSSAPVQLTDTRDEFETNPLWIAKNKIAYLSWRPADSSWTLKSISLARSDAKPETLLEIPQEWYTLP